MIRRILAGAATTIAIGLLLLAAYLVAPADMVRFAAAFLLPSLAFLQITLIGLAVLLLLAGRVLEQPAAWTSVARRGALLGSAAIVLAIAWRDLRYYRRETVRMADGAEHFEATLYRPRQAAAHAPAVLILHGSGPLKRSAYHDVARRFAQRGFVVLNVDKRGVGGSSGVYYGDDLGRDSVIERRARDAGVALRFLSALAGVDSNRVGVVALSQGGWIVPLLLHGDTPARFAVNLSGAAVSSREEGEWSDWTRESEDHFGLKPPPVPFDVLDARLRSVAAGPFDPRPYLFHMRAPSLWLFGEWDSSLPTSASVRVLDSVRAEGVDATVHVFPGANHALMVVRGPDGRRLANYAPGVWDTVFSWLAREPGSATR